MFSVDNNWYIFLKHVQYTWDDFYDFSMVLLTPCFWFLGVVRRNFIKNKCRWTFCYNFASSYLWWIKEEERLEKSQTTNIHLLKQFYFTQLNFWTVDLTHWFFREQHQQALLAYYYEISLLYNMHDFDSFLRKVRYV